MQIAVCTEIACQRATCRHVLFCSVGASLPMAIQRVVGNSFDWCERVGEMEWGDSCVGLLW